MPVQPVLIAGRWRPARSAGTFFAANPATGQNLADEYPVSTWADCDEALSAAADAAPALAAAGPEKIAAFLTGYAQRIEANAAQIAQTAHEETGLAVSPRLKDVELPRTAGQLRQAAAAALEGSWALPTIDTKLNIRSYHAPLGPVCVIGPNNFPLAFNSVSGGDFAAAFAAGNPVIAKGHPSHPTTTRLLAQEALAALAAAGLPPACVQLIYRTSKEDGLRLASDPRMGGLAFTGSRGAGMKLKAAADSAGKPIYLEMSSLNPVVILPGALKQRGEKIADEYADSALMGSGQFCTKPGLVLLVAGPESDAFIGAIRQRYESRKPSTLLSTHVAGALADGVKTLVNAGASTLIGGAPLPGPAVCFANTLLRVDGDRFLANPHQLQTEAFGNAALLIVARDAAQARAVLSALEGNLTGCVYSDTDGSDEAAYALLAPVLRARVGRLLNDKMPTGVAVSPAMNHGGPFPSTGHPAFTAVGIPASLRRFAMLQCFDNVRPARLPAALANANPTGKMWRSIDGQPTIANVP